nr:MAG TPA: hypothetical protein [Bacteriophage sp.]
MKILLNLLSMTRLCIFYQFYLIIHLTTINLYKTLLKIMRILLL